MRRLDGLKLKGTHRRPKRRRSFRRDEEDLIIKLHALLGHRTENEIKDYWHSHLKRKLVGMGIDPNNHRPNQTFLLARHRRNYEDNHDIRCDDDATSSLVEGEEFDNNNNNSNLDLKLQLAVGSSSSSSSSSSSCGAAQSDESVRAGPAEGEERGNYVDDNNETSTLLLFT
ncbi:Myb-related protein Zm38 [Linum grandiflorum]